MNNTPMKKLLLILLLLAAPFYAQAQNGAKKDVNLMAAAVKANTSYKQGGMSALFSAAMQCYAQGKTRALDGEAVEFCVALDMSAAHIDASMAQAAGFPRDERFTDQATFLRIQSFLEQQTPLKGAANAQQYIMARNERVQKYTARAVSMTPSTSSKSDGAQQCADRRMAAWDKARDSEIKKWCSDMARKGQECRISAGVEEDTRKEKAQQVFSECSRSTR